MGRFIDADALIARISETEERCKAGSLAKFVMNAVKSEIDREPTAYDVEKVVAELEKQKSGLTDWAEDKAFEIAIEKAINLVRKGGIDG